MNVRKVKYGSSNAALDFATSLRETGFAVLSDHPIEPNLVDGVFREWGKFFSNSRKADYTFNPQKQDGYFPFKSENAKGAAHKDLKEFYHVYPFSKLPEGLTDATWKLYRDMNSLAAELLGWIESFTPDEIRRAYSMPLPEMIQNSQQTLLRILHYPPIVGEIVPGEVRAAAHEDINLITLLPAATEPGLQVLSAAGQWYDVPCDPGNIVINAGDMLQECSRRFFKSTTHQVVNPKGGDASRSRYSMPLFLHPRPDVRLSPQYTADEYLTQRLREIGLK